MSNIHYFRATLADVPIMVGQRIAFLLGYLGPQTDEDISQLKQSLEQYFTNAMRNNTYICWFAKVGDEIGGIGGLVIREQPGNFQNPSGKVGYLISMYTAPGHRRKGICGNIVRRLVDTAKEMGIHTFELHATKEGEPVYIKQGFKLHEEPTYRKVE
jgi:GNAT superfamily N-acetyltransferase